MLYRSGFHEAWVERGEQARRTHLEHAERGPISRRIPPPPDFSGNLKVELRARAAADQARVVEPIR